MNVEKSINKSDQIPTEFGAIPEKREGAESAPPPSSDMLVNIDQNTLAYGVEEHSLNSEDRIM